MWAAGIATIFYGFLCNEKLQLIYMSTVAHHHIQFRERGLTILQFSFSALFCAFETSTPRFDSPQFTSWRAVLHATFGLSFVMFVVHGLVLYGWEEQQRRMSLVYMLRMAAVNLLGAVIDAARVTGPTSRYLPPAYDFLDSRKMGALHVRYPGRQSPDPAYRCRERSLDPLSGTS